MRENPSGKDLLDIAREVLREELIPALPADKKYSALMIANAMAIVMRQIEAGQETDVSRLELKTLAERIRSGGVEGRETWQALRKTALGKVAESNPKYL
jgi:hypothetical protein